MIALALAVGLALPAQAARQDSTPYTVAFRIDVGDTTPVFERQLGPSLILRVRRAGRAGWTVAVVRSSGQLDGRNLLYHSPEWHGPYPTDVLAWSYQQKLFPDERVLPVSGHPYEVRVRLIGCRTTGSGDTAAFAAGTIEVGWRRVASSSLPPQSRDSLVVEVAGRSTVLRAPDLAALPRDSVQWAYHGTSHWYAGIRLVAVLRRVGIPMDSLKGHDLTRRVVVEAADRYRAVFALAEIAPGIGSREVLLADREDGRPLAPNAGPWRLVVPADGSGARGVRQVVALRVRDEP